MKNTPILWIQRKNKKILWDFGSIAEWGGRQLKWEIKFFEDAAKIPFDKKNVLFASVEQSMLYFETHKMYRPMAINPLFFQHFLKRDCEVKTVDWILNENKTWPIFAKPYMSIKAFTGTVLLNDFDAHCVLNQVNRRLECLTQEVVDPIISEWRCYINRGSIVALKHYLGDSLTFPDQKFVIDCFQYAQKHLKNISYTLDFGVGEIDGDVETFLIEPNDGWAIGCYGLDPMDYVKFCKDRWWEIQQNNRLFTI